MSEEVDIARCVKAVTDAIGHIEFIRGYHTGGRKRGYRSVALEHVKGYQKALEEIERYCPDSVKTRSFYIELRSIRESPPETNLDFHSWGVASAHLYDVLHRLEIELDHLVKEYA